MMSDMIVVPGPASIELGKLVASELGLEPHPIDHRIFPDGESYIRLTTSVQDETIILVQTTAPAPDQKLLQLLMMAGTANDLGADRIVCVVPYLAYSRQDKRFMEGEALSLDVVVGLMEGLGMDDMIVVDAHNEKSLRMIEGRHDVNIVNLSAIPLLAEELLGRGFEGAYSLSPDEGAIHLAKAGAKVLGGEYGFFEKMRDRRTGEIEMKVRDLEIGGKRAVVFDDIVSSGGTMAMAVEGLKAQGAEMVAAACTHALFMEGAKGRIERAGADLIVSSDTVQKRVCGITVTVAPLIAKSIKELIH